MKIIIAGSRSFNDYNHLYTQVEQTLDSKYPEYSDIEIEIVSGHARGVDQLGERYAKEKSYTLTIFPADWNTYGKSAGCKRNIQMAVYSDVLIAFWDGKSRGTAHMINKARELGLEVVIHRF